MRIFDFLNVRFSAVVGDTSSIWLPLHFLSTSVILVHLLPTFLEGSEILLLWHNSVICILHYGRDHIDFLQALFYLHLGNLHLCLYFWLIYISPDSMWSPQCPSFPQRQKNPTKSGQDFTFAGKWIQRRRQKSSWQDFTAENCDQCPIVDYSLCSASCIIPTKVIRGCFKSV